MAHNVYHEGYERTNSLTSFNSFHSMATMEHQGQHVARGSSTTELLAVDRFARPSRAKPQLRNSTSMASLSSKNRYSSLTSQSPMPRANSFQPGAMSDLYHNSFRPSSSLTNIPAYRRQSVENAHIHKMKQHFYQQQAQQAQQLQAQQQLQPQKGMFHLNGDTAPQQQQLHKPQLPQQPRRNSHMPQVPFTFPNGEVYIPRHKQRNSFTNLNKLDTSASVQPPAAPISPKKTQAPQFPRVSQQVYTHEPSISSCSNTNSYSSSPSPSRASRTNSSVNDSTPPSSIDDLTIQPTYSAQTTEKSSEQLLSIVAASKNLGKIEEHAPIDTPVQQKLLPSLTVPTSAVSETTVKDTIPSAVVSPEKSVESLVQEEQVTEEMEQKQVENAEPVVQPIAIAIAQPVALPQVKIQPQPQPNTTTKMTLKSKNSVQSLKTQASAPALERKPSAIKRFFSKMFSKKSKPLTTPKPSKTNQKLASSPLKSAPVVPKPTQAQTPPEQQQTHPLQRQVSAHSDVFSFVDGDEDKGITVIDLMSMKLDNPDFGHEKGQDSLTVNFDTPQEEKNVEVQEERLIVKKNRDKSQVTPEDNEDAVITFDDMEFIEKMIEYGETSFPDLSASDLGQSQRKLMRSKSIERKKSTRSISSASKLSMASSPSTLEPEDEFNEQLDMEHVQIVYTNQLKTPHSSMIKSRPSILKKNRMSHPSHKKVGFTNQVYVNNTYPPHMYNRHPSSVSFYQLSPQIIQQIRQELNEFKRGMLVHEASLGNTQFFRAT